ncbi:MAG TPA: AI-2E family transporter [Calditrichia bacterium]|nr:AI-2E family transporter [Calditrichia bacterium]
MNESRNFSDTQIIIFLLSVIALMGLGAILYVTRAVILPLALAVFLSFILEPVIAFFERRGVPSILAIIFTLLITFLMAALLGILVNSSIQSFAEEFPKYEAKYQKHVSGFFDALIALFEPPPELLNGEMSGGKRFKMLNTLSQFSLSDMITATLGAVTRFLSNFLLVLLFLLFILMGRNQLSRKLIGAFDRRTSRQMSAILQNINQQIQRYIVAKTLISLLTAIFTTSVLLLFQVEFAIIWGVLTFLLNFIPSIGSVLAVFMPVTIAFLQFETYGITIVILVVLSVIQLGIGTILDPRLVGERVDLSPLVILFSLIAWGWLWGIVGMFLAVPLSVILKIIFQNSRSLRFISILMSSRPPSPPKRV